MVSAAAGARARSRPGTQGGPWPACAAPAGERQVQREGRSPRALRSAAGACAATVVFPLALDLVKPFIVSAAEAIKQAANGAAARREGEER